MEPFLCIGHSAWALQLLPRDRLKYRLYMAASGPQQTLLAPDQKVLRVLKYFYCGKFIHSMRFAILTILSVQFSGIN